MYVHGFIDNITPVYRLSHFTAASLLTAIGCQSDLETDRQTDRRNALRNGHHHDHIIIIIIIMMVK